MKKLTTFGLGAAAFAAFAFAATPAMAHDPTTGEGPTIQNPHAVDAHDELSFDHFLRAVDVLMNREQMEARWPDVIERLIDVAEDREATTFERWRATSLLGNFQEDQARNALLGLTDDSEERVRSMAYYVLGVVFLHDGDDALFERLEAGLSDESQRVRADVVRSFGWTDHSGAHRILQEIAADDHGDLQRTAQRSLQRLER